MDDITAKLERADGLLGSMFRMYPLAVQREQYSGLSAEDLYKKVLDTRQLEPTLEHRAQLGLGWFYAILTDRPLGIQHIEDAYNHLYRAYELKPQDNETIYLFSRACHLLNKTDQAPFGQNEPKFKVLKELVEQEVRDRWLNKVA